MAATCFKSKNQVKTETWSSIFSSFNTETKSCFFLKQLTTTCISTILYLRKILPEDYFESKNFEGMTLRFLKTGKGFLYVDKIEKWLEGAFDAIDKKYLKHLMLDIKDAESKMSLEIYTMTFHYQKGNEAPNVLLSKTESKKNSFRGFTICNTQLRTIRLLQMCHAVTQTCSSLPARVTIAIRLSYHEDTPQDYHPSGYKAWEPTDPMFPKPTRSIEIGVTGTDHHFFKLVNKSCFNEKFLKLEDLEEQEGDKNSTPRNEDQLLDVEQDELENESLTKAKRELCYNNPDMNSRQNVKIFFKGESSSPFDRNADIYDSQKNTLTSYKDHNKAFEARFPDPKKNSQETTDASNCESSIFEGERKAEGVRCPCLSMDKTQSMFTCSRCRYLLHAECFGVLQFDFTKKIRFYCHICHKTKNEYKCLDKVMTSLKRSSDQQKLALLRRILKFITLSDITKITLRKMEKIAGSNTSKNIIEIVLNKLIEIGVIVPQKAKKNYLIDKKKLNERTNHYFYQFHRHDAIQTKIPPRPMRTPELKRKDINSGEFFENKKCRKSFASPLVLDTQQSLKPMSQQSGDIFQYVINN